MFRQLTQDDISQLGNVLPKSKIEEFVSTYLQGYTTWFAFGLFRDSQLVAISTAYHTGYSHEWYMLKQHAEKAEDLEKIVSEICNYFEASKVYKFYWLDSDYYVDFMMNYIPEKYVHFKEYTLPPLKLPKNLKHLTVLYDEKFFPVNSTVYMSVLPDKHRHL